MLKEIKKVVGRFGRTKNGTLNSIEDMVININNNYVKRINENEEELKKYEREVKELTDECCNAKLDLMRAQNKIETYYVKITQLKRQLEIVTTELKDAKSEKKKLLDYLKKAGELLKTSNEIAKENHALKKPTKKDVKLSIMGKVSSDAKAKMK